MRYFDKNGKEIRAGMKILMEDGSIEMVYDTEDQYGNPNLGINASNEEFLKLHPNWAREYYSLSMFKQSGIEVCPSEQEIRTELEELAPIIEGTELALDYGEKVSKEDYEKYEAAITLEVRLNALPTKILLLEGEDDIEFINKFLERLHSMLLPCPHHGGNVVMHGDAL